MPWQERAFVRPFLLVRQAGGKNKTRDIMAVIKLL